MKSKNKGINLAEMKRANNKMKYMAEQYWEKRKNKEAKNE